MSTTPKQLIFEEAARKKLLSGIDQVADVVAFTLGAKGRNVGIEKSWGAPTITNDGGSIVKEINLKDPYENMGASMAKEVAQKIKEKSGDGTTTGTLLLRALVSSALKYISSGASPIGLKRGVDKGVEAVVKAIETLAIPVNSIEDARNIATVSASGNSDVGNLIAQALEKVGKDGVITIEESKTTATTIEIVEGMEFDRGYLSPYFSTNTDKMTVEMNNPAILLIDKKISNIHEILPILQSIASSGRELLIVAEDIEGDALSTLVVNRLRGTLKVAAVKAPGFGDRRKALLEDLGILTGATVISEETGTSLKDVTVDLLGTAEKITITKDHTLIVNGQGLPERIKARIKQIENEIENTSSSYDKEKLLERKAKLSGGVAVIRVGGATEPEVKQKKQIFEDSLNSTKAAQEGGIVPGGGVALLRASQAAAELKLEGDEALGAQIVVQACQTPIRQIASNAGFEGSVVLSEVLKSPATYGFNVLSEKCEDLVKSGVIDPANVVINSLIHASSVAGIVMISEVLIADAPEEDNE